jgi:regulator of sirC expression with transglutaminase-like and TPR domain
MSEVGSIHALHAGAIALCLQTTDPWLTLARAQGENFNLLGACMLLAKDEYPKLDCQALMDEFNALCTRARKNLSNTTDFLERLAALVKFIHAAENFHGNALDFDNPKNSYLNDLLQRKSGIPISLALIYIELGKHCDIEFQPVGFPGHFLLSVTVGSGVLVLDPFYFGKALGFEELRHRLRANLTEAEEIADDLVFDAIRPCSERQMFIRMLLNLRSIYREHDDSERYLRVLNRLVLLTDHADLLRERAQHCFNLGAMNSAISDLEAFLARAPSALDEEDAHALLVQARLSKPALN